MVASELLDRVGGLRAVVLGDPILDTFVVGRATRICLESPVPVVLKESEETDPGGAANVAAGLAALGADVTLVGVVGDDAAGRRLRRLLEAAHVDTSGLVVEAERPTTHKLRIVAGGQYVARVDEERPGPAREETQEVVAERFSRAAAAADVVVVADYQGTALAGPVHAALAAARAERDLPVVADSKQMERLIGLGPTAVTPNLEEAVLFVGGGEAEDAVAIAECVRRRIGCETAIVTLGARGAALAGPAGAVRIPAPAVAVANAVGAGDSFTCGLALGLAAGADVVDSARLGCEVAAAAVAKPNTAVVTRQELAARLRGHPVAGFDDVAEAVRHERDRGRRVVFTNGVFDLLHPGHADLLARAKRLGDLLVVGVNGDRSARELKGAGRPVMGERERCELVAGLDCVDYAFVFDAPTAEAIVAELQPDVYVKGDDHDAATLPEAGAVAATGGEIVLLPRTGGMSTSAIIDRILSNAAPR